LEIALILAKRIVEWICKIEAFLAGFLLAIATGSIGLQLASRALRDRALPWPEEFCVILLIYLSFLGAGALYKQQAHLGVDFFIRRFLPKHKQALAARIVWFLSLIAFVLLLIGALKGMKHSMMYTSGAAIPIKRGYLRLPVIFMCLTNLFASAVFLLELPKNKTNT
jgi:TRAP-type C4-dicarboxylate transport system permease small subunit